MRPLFWPSEIFHSVHPILFSESIDQDLAQCLSSIPYSQLFVICDENSQKYCLPKVQSLVPSEANIFVASSGENHKTLATCEKIWAKMTESHLDRKALVINLGGGVITDMGGFCSSIYKRGIRFINIPTTLLSQVDASVGGKLGVDFNGLKNHLGVFNEPEAVIISDEFLGTLPLQELRSGFAEIMKHGLIQDAAYFKSLNFKDWKNSDWKQLIKHSVEIKKNVVLQDPKEGGLRKILNFGHTIGHAVETFYLDSSQHLLHGEAIAIGMICEGFLSSQMNVMYETDLKLIIDSFIQVYGKVTLPDQDLESIVDLCLQDKKNEGSTLLFSLLSEIGKCEYNIPVTRTQIVQALNFYQNLPH